MATTTLHIRNMVCNRCILVVRQLLEGLGLTPLHIELGKAIVQEELPARRPSGAEGGIGGRGIRTDRRQALAADRTAAQRSDRGWYTTTTAACGRTCRLPVGEIPQRLQCPEQVVLGDDRYHAGKILHRTAHRTRQRAVGIQRVVTRRDRRQDRLFEHGAPERPVQKRHRYDAQRIPEAERPGNAGRSTRYEGSWRRILPGGRPESQPAPPARPRKAPEDISPHIPASLREHGRGTDGGGQGRSKGNTTATSPTQRQRVRRERDKGRISGLSVAIRTAENIPESCKSHP